MGRGEGRQGRGFEIVRAVGGEESASRSKGERGEIACRVREASREEARYLSWLAAVRECEEPLWTD